MVSNREDQDNCKGQDIGEKRNMGEKGQSQVHSQVTMSGQGQIIGHRESNSGRQSETRYIQLVFISSSRLCQFQSQVNKVKFSLIIRNGEDNISTETMVLKRVKIKIRPWSSSVS